MDNLLKKFRFEVTIDGFPKDYLQPDKISSFNQDSSGVVDLTRNYVKLCDYRELKNKGTLFNMNIAALNSRREPIWKWSFVDCKCIYEKVQGFDTAASSDHHLKSIYTIEYSKCMCKGEN
jgi:hypothetical protein